MTANDARLVKRHYSDSRACRVLLADAPVVLRQLPRGPGRWLDAGFDGFPGNALLGQKVEENAERYPNRWYNRMKCLPAFELLMNKAVIEKTGTRRLSKKQNTELKATVFGLLDECLRLGADMITVPQLAQGGGPARNCVNMALAKLTAEWAGRNPHTGLVYPIIFSKVSGQTTSRAAWQSKVDTAIKYCGLAGATTCWLVDASLDEEKAASTLRSERFPRLVEIHQYLRKELADKEIMAGPYWGFNILLWARRLIDLPVIAVGSGFQYHLSGGRATKATPRAALPPLRRLAIADRQLERWFAEALAKLSPSEPEFSQLARSHQELRRTDDQTMKAVDELEAKELEMDKYEELQSAGVDAQGIYAELEVMQQEVPIRSMSDQWRDQVAKFYKQWMISIAEAPPAGRALRLYQQLSRAYMLGKVLGGKVADRTGYDSRPESHAEQLMQHCL